MTNVSPKTKGQDTLNGEKKRHQHRRTLRIELNLEEPNEEATNEYSYAHLVNDAFKKKEEPQCEGDITESHLAKIARDLEAKFGSAAKKKRIVHDADFVDYGYGYDTSDSFVDDSEAVEDFVPLHVDTAYGGFYVNAGDLQFKPSKDVTVDDYNFMNKRKKKPTIPKQPSHGTPQTLWASMKVKQAKQQVASAKKSKKASSLSKPLGDQRSSISGEAKIKKKPSKSLQSRTLFTSETLKSQKPPESVPVVTSPVGTQKLASAVSPEQSSTQLSSSTEDEGKLPQGSVVNKGPPPELPEGIPVNIHQMITDLKEDISQGMNDGKLSIKARNQLDSKLMILEKACRDVSTKVKTGIFDHLAALLSVSRQSLVSRTRKMMRKIEEDKLKLPMEELSTAISEQMAVQLKKYEEDLALAQAIVAPPTQPGANASAVLSDVEMEIGQGNEKIEDMKSDDETNHGPQANGSTQPKKAKKVRKHFRWNTDIKQLLIKIVKIKIELEQMKKKIIPYEEFVGQFLEESIKPFWPKGWMTKGILLKISEPAYKHLILQQPKKTIALPLSIVSDHSKSTVPVKTETKKEQTSSQAPLPSNVLSVVPSVVAMATAKSYTSTTSTPTLPQNSSKLITSDPSPMQENSTVSGAVSALPITQSSGISPSSTIKMSTVPSSSAVLTKTSPIKSTLYLLPSDKPRLSPKKTKLAASISSSSEQLLHTISYQSTRYAGQQEALKTSADTSQVNVLTTASASSSAEHLLHTLSYQVPKLVLQQERPTVTSQMLSAIFGTSSSKQQKPVVQSSSPVLQIAPSHFIPKSTSPSSRPMPSSVTDPPLVAKGRVLSYSPQPKRQLSALLMQSQGDAPGSSQSLPQYSPAVALPSTTMTRPALPLVHVRTSSRNPSRIFEEHSYQSTGSHQLQTEEAVNTTTNSTQVKPSTFS